MDSDDQIFAKLTRSFKNAEEMRMMFYAVQAGRRFGFANVINLLRKFWLEETMETHAISEKQARAYMEWEERNNHNV